MKLKKGGMILNILAVDPRPDKLEQLRGCILKNHPNAKVYSFTDPMLAYQFGVNNTIDSVYTIINMTRLSGFELSKMLRKLHPQILTNYIDQTDHFRRDAMRLAAYTYLVEPITPELMRKAETDAAAYEKEDEEN